MDLFAERLQPPLLPQEEVLALPRETCAVLPNLFCFAQQRLQSSSSALVLRAERFHVLLHAVPLSRRVSVQSGGLLE
eukprot:7050554-Prorocentrum_lima.AAC.1